MIRARLFREGAVIRRRRNCCCFRRARVRIFYGDESLVASAPRSRPATEHPFEYELAGRDGKSAAAVAHWRHWRFAGTSRHRRRPANRADAENTGTVFVRQYGDDTLMVVWAGRR